MYEEYFYDYYIKVLCFTLFQIMSICPHNVQSQYYKTSSEALQQCQRGSGRNFHNIKCMKIHEKYFAKLRLNLINQPLWATAASWQVYRHLEYFDCSQPHQTYIVKQGNVRRNHFSENKLYSQSFFVLLLSFNILRSILGNFSIGGDAGYSNWYHTVTGSK